MKALKSSVLGAVLVLQVALTGCAGSKLSPQDDTDLGVFAAEISLCNTQPNPASCKLAVKAAFDAAQTARFDGGYVAPDGGVL